MMKNSVDLGFKNMSIFNKDDTRGFYKWGDDLLDIGIFKLANSIFSLPVCYFAIKTS